MADVRSSLARSFFLPDGDGYVATEWTRGPWNDRHQHGGPPVALLGRAIERHAAADAPVPLHPARLTFEFLRPVPMGRVRIVTRDERPGARVRLVAGALSVDGVEVLRATALLIRRAVVDLPPLPADASPPPRPPEESEPFVLSIFGPLPGYDKAMELRMAGGVFGEGPTQAWMRMRVPLLPDEAPSPLTRVLAAADSGNGVSAVLSPRRFLFVNPELTVHLHRLPEGDWVCLDAASTLTAAGVGLAVARLWDVRGPLGVGAQSLFVDHARSHAGGGGATAEGPGRGGGEG